MDLAIGGSKKQKTHLKLSEKATFVGGLASKPVRADPATKNSDAPPECLPIVTLVMVARLPPTSSQTTVPATNTTTAPPVVLAKGLKKDGQVRSSSAHHSDKERGQPQNLFLTMPTWCSTSFLGLFPNAMSIVSQGLLPLALPRVQYTNSARYQSISFSFPSSLLFSFLTKASHLFSCRCWLLSWPAPNVMRELKRILPS